MSFSHLNGSAQGWATAVSKLGIAQKKEAVLFS
jgi:hypothetical protein